MRFADAKKRAFIKLCAGIFITALTVMSTLISMLKMLYFSMDEGYTLAGKLAGSIKNFVEVVYHNTGFLEPLWSHSPIPDFTQLTKPDNFYFFVIYLMIFVGFSFVASARKLLGRLKAIQEMIEEQLIAESIRGSLARTREEIEASVQLPRSSIFSQAHSLYLAPIFTTIVGTLVLKFVFGIG